VTSTPARPPSGSTRALVLGGALLLLLVSRLPFLVSDVDWGVFQIEHTWMVTDPAALHGWEEVSGQRGDLEHFDPELYGSHYHAGGLWLTEAVGFVGRITGDYGLREFKLVGLLGTAVALCAYLLALMAIWPQRRARWWLPALVAWIAPPTLLLWLTLMPMGHYMETWFFHAVFLPPLVAVLSDRAGPGLLLVTGLAIGLATTYVFSNIVFVVLLGGLFLLLSEKSLKVRIIGTVALGGAFLGTWLPTVAPRIHSIGVRFGEAGIQPAPVGALRRIGLNLARSVSPQSIVHGDGWSQRGLLAVLEPAGGTLGTAAAYALFVGCALGAAYLLRPVVALVRQRRALDLEGRFLAAQGLFLLGTLACYAVFLDDGWEVAMVSYLAFSYPALMLGLALGAAALLERSADRRWLALPVAALVLLLAVGWGQSAALNLRSLDRPDAQRADFLAVSKVVKLAHGDNHWSDAAGVEEICLKAYPGNEAFCAVAGWEFALSTPVFGPGGPVDPGPCEGAPADRQLACHEAAGAQSADAGRCDEPGSMAAGQAATCAGVPPGALRQACMSGLYRSPIWGVNAFARCTRSIARLCQEQEPEVLWRQRACMEATAMTLTGMPVMPGPPDSVSARCADWPKDWQGVCEDSRPRQAAPDETSCEQVYLDRFATELPARNALSTQMCFVAASQEDGHTLFPSCVIGVARALEGLECSWAGTDLRTQ